MGRTVGRSAGLLLMAVALVACSSSPPGSDFEQVGTVTEPTPGPGGLTGRVGRCEINDDCAALFDDNDCRVPSCTPDGKCLSLPQPDGSVCDDANACTTGEACVAGACAGGENGCSCEDDAGCEDFQDPNLCHARLSCVAGTCELDPSTEVVCDHSGGLDCFDTLCNPVNGACEPVSRSDGAPCDDGDACTTGSVCVDSVCSPGSPVECSGSGPCTTGACEPGLGCLDSPLEDGLVCSDGNACTENDACDAGVCVPGESVCVCQDDGDCAPFQGNPCEAPLACVEGQCVVTGDGTPCPEPEGPCMVAGCDSETLECIAVAAENGTPCGTGDGCASQATCSVGVCVVPADVCDDGDPCTTDTCDPIKDCSHQPAEGPCDDQDPCTEGDVCADGACAPGQPVCDCQEAADCLGDDFNHCLGEPSCEGGKCVVVAGTAVTCAEEPDLGPCKTLVCEPATGECVGNTSEDGVACSSGDACQMDEACAAGVCEGGVAKCDDGNPCTSDSCIPGVGCSNSPVSGPCDDANACTTSDTCIAGGCFGGAAVKCESDNPCITATCDKQEGCLLEPVQEMVLCDDGNPCTVQDLCLEGGCAGTSVCQCESDADCDDDGDPCNGEVACEDNLCVVVPETVVSCPDLGPCLKSNCDSGSGQCETAPANNGDGCVTAGPCVQNAVCDGGSCVGEPVVCDDQNPCTAATCDDSAGGCVFVPAIDWGCDDGDPCTVKDHCSGGACVGTSPFACDDSDACTEDVCVPGVGCKGTDVVCDDQDPCTIDLCDPNTGCSFVSKCAAAVDLAPCTEATCDDGVCGTAPSVDGTACQPSSVCTDQGACEAGECVASDDGITCDDNNACTNDLCDAAQGCFNEEIACDDGDLCTIDACDLELGCSASPKCPADVPGDCKVPSCDPDDGICGSAEAPTGTACEPAGSCFAAGSCEQGLCVGDGDPADCNDDDPCTNDTCDPEVGCQNTSIPSGTCDDGNPCTEGDICGVNGCVGVIVDCDDNDACTEDACSDAGACVNEAIPGCGVDGIPCDGVGGSTCNDQDSDTVNDLCIQGICRGFETLYLIADNADTDLALTRVDHAHDMWFVAAEHGGVVGEVFGVQGYTEGKYDLSLYENVSPEGNADLGIFTGLHNGFAATENGWLLEFVPGADGGSWSDGKPISAAFSDEGLAEVGCLWASGPSGSAASAVWVGGARRERCLCPLLSQHGSGEQRDLFLSGCGGVV